MKSSKYILFIVFAMFSFISCKQTDKDVIAPKETVSNEKIAINPDELITSNFTVEGMSCQIGCAAMLEKKLAKMDGVQEAKVDFEKQLATVTYDKTQQTPNDFIEKVTSALDGKTYKAYEVK